MQLDASTLYVLMIAVTSVVSLLLLWAWLQNRRVKALAWWGVAYLHAALGSALILPRGQIPDWFSIDIANALLVLAYGLMWIGGRIFDGRKVRASFLLGAAVWLAACQYGPFYASFPARSSLSAFLIGVYSLLAAWDFWRASEPLASRSAAALCLSLHGVISLSRVLILMFYPATHGVQPLSGFWFAFIAFEAILFSIAVAFLLLAMAKERVELHYKTVSRIDPLTEALNRRAFVSMTKRIIARADRDRCSVAILLFDLDHFKKINDAHGHQFGDDVLKLFCQIADANRRPGDVFGRLGGEEFAICLPAVDLAGAREMADRISSAFAAAGNGFIDMRLRTTVSVGIALSDGAHASLDDLIAAADRGLYRAKRLGRNRIEDEILSTSQGATRSEQLASA
jgi:diguanylate cyclase (GGDEF)-like protein